MSPVALTSTPAQCSQRCPSLPSGDRPTAPAAPHLTEDSAAHPDAWNDEPIVHLQRTQPSPGVSPHGGVTRDGWAPLGSAALATAIFAAVRGE